MRKYDLQIFSDPVVIVTGGDTPTEPTSMVVAPDTSLRDLLMAEMRADMATMRGELDALREADRAQYDEAMRALEDKWRTDDHVHELEARLDALTAAVADMWDETVVLDSEPSGTVIVDSVPEGEPSGDTGEKKYAGFLY